MPIKVKCIMCGKSIVIPPSRYKQSNGNFYCSINCKGEWQKEHLKGKSNPQWKGVFIKCDYCGEIIHKEPNQLKGKKNHFCSRRCQWKHFSENYSGKNNSLWTDRILVNCDYCGKKLNKPRWEVYEHNFCSQNCFHKWLTPKISGENNHNWNGGSSSKPYTHIFIHKLREKIRIRDNLECQICNLSQEENLRKYRKKLNVHHIDGNKTNDKLDNLISLCNKCHSKVHRGILEIRPQFEVVQIA